MTYQLENEQLKIEVKAQGAELSKVTSNEGIDYLWSADPTYWNRHAPVLFPIVGRVTDNQYTHAGQTYELGQHGFARDQKFECIKENGNEVVFELRSSEESKGRFPFDFILELGYKLEGNQVTTSYTVKNPSEEEIHFAIGGHPGFMCPLLADETMEDYYLELEVPEETTRLGVSETVHLNGQDTSFTGQTIELSHKLFREEGVIILKDLKSKTMALKSHKNNHSVTMNFEGFPFLGIWSPEHIDAPFVCIEPWVGHTDYEDASKELSEKKDFVALKPGETFNIAYQLTFK